MKLKAAGATLGAVVALIAFGVSVSADWTSYHFDGAHTGYDPSVPTITSFSSSWSTNVNGLVLAEPLYFNGQVYVVTMHDWLYALNPVDGSITWSYHIDNPFPASQIICNSVPGDAVGIMSTPIIDPAAGVIYMVGMTSLGFFHLWAVNLSTHNLVYQPVSVDPFPIDPGYTQQTQQNNYQNQRGALALNSTGTLFIPYGGRNGDCGNYHGYVIAVHASDGTGVSSWHTTFSALEAGIWAPGGVALDAGGNALVATGNGSRCSLPYDDGEQVLKLSPSLVQMTSWAPSNWASLNCSDTDIGSTAPSPVGNNLVFQSGKNGVGYLLNSTNMGGIGGEVYQAQVCNTQSFGSNAYANGVIYVPCQDGVHALTLGTNSFTSLWNYTGITAGPPIVAAGAVWVIDTSGNTLTALDPATGALIGTPQNLAGGVEHFVTPSEGGGNIYVPGSGFVQAFAIGQWKASYNMSSAPTTWAAGQTQTFPVTVTNTGNFTWPSTGYTAVDLDLHFATSAGGSANQANWLTSQAFSLPADVLAGASATVNVTVTAPSNTGSLVLEAEMIKEHQFWFAQFSAVNVTVNNASWSASYNMSSAPTTWISGQSQTFPVTVTNTGTTTWPSTGYTEVDLDLHFAKSSGGSGNQANWLTSQAFALPGDVAPNASATVNVTVTAPSSGGSLVLEAEMIKEHQFWFTQFAFVNVTVTGPIWSAAYNMSSAPTSWVAGQSQTFPVTVTNNGNQTWPSTGYTAVDFDLHFTTVSGGSAQQSHWLNSQAFSLPANLAPSASVTLTVTFAPPANASGSMFLESEMIKEHQFWFAQQSAVSVTVTPPIWSAQYNLTNVPTTWTAGQSKTFTVTVTNNGNQTWPSTGYTEVDLDFHFTTVVGGSSQQTYWKTSQAFALPSNVNPGASVTVMVTVTAPSSKGSMFLEAEMIKEHQFWFTQVSSVSVMVN